MKYCLSLCLLFIYSLCYPVKPEHLPESQRIKRSTLNLADDGVLKVLAIGNSFSEDAIENYLFDLAKTAHKKIVIGNLYIGGASLALHASNVQQNKPAYSYRKIDIKGAKTTLKDISILTALEDDNWDYISFQQASPYSGLLESYSPDLEVLTQYVRSHLKTQQTKFILHQTWAYAENSTHTGFANYHRNQQEMYQAIMNASKTVFENPAYNFSLLVPSGTAIQNMRTTYIGDHLNRDGYHLELNYGRFTAACTWYEKLFNKNVTKNAFVPENLSKKMADMAKLAAHSAVANPYAVTPLKKYAINKDAGKFSSTIQVSFGKEVSISGWNSFSSPMQGYTIKYLKDIKNKDTDIAVSITDRFNSTNSNGPKNLYIGDYNIPDEVSASSYFGNTKGSHGGAVVEKSGLEFKNLNPKQAYKICFLSSRTAEDTENRETQLTAIGSNTQTASINATNNTKIISCLENVRPDQNGIVKVYVTAGPHNNTAIGYYYLNALYLSLGRNN